jgi:hypothetical protein
MCGFGVKCVNIIHTMVRYLPERARGRWRHCWGTMGPHGRSTPDCVPPETGERGCPCKCWSTLVYAIQRRHIPLAPETNFMSSTPGSLVSIQLLSFGNMQWSKSKAIPKRGRGGLKGCEMMRIPYCVGNRLTDGGRIVNLTHRHALFPTNNIFLLLVLISVTGREKPRA